MDKKPAPSNELVVLLQKFFEKFHRLPDKGEFLRFAKVDEWQVRKCGGMPGLYAAAGINSVEAGLRLATAKLRSENERLRSQVQDLEDQALGSEFLRRIIHGADPTDINVDRGWLEGATKQKNTKGIAVLMLSDVHFDEVVRPEQINHCNSYNRQTAIRRLKNVFRNTVVLLKGHMSAAKYDGIICNLGGDIFSGIIHEELAETNEGAIGQSMMIVEELLIEGIGGLADEFGKVYVPCVTGNHGRMHKKPRHKNRAFLNFEWIIYQHLAKYFRNDSRISFTIPDGPDAMYPVYGKRYCLTHGDQFRGGEGVGGIMVPIMRGASKKAVRQQAISQPFDVILMGHWHQYIHMDRMVINGSVKGYDEFAFAMNFPFEPAQQALFIAHPEAGMTFRMPVLCDKS
jgi:hypothetical protein